MAFRHPNPALIAILLAGCGARPTAPAAAAKPPRAAAPAPAPAAAKPGKPGKPVTVLIAEGRKAYAGGDFATATRSFEQVLSTDPIHHESLLTLALMAERQAIELPRPLSSPYYLRAAEMLRRLFAAHPELSPTERGYLPGILYNESCTLAINGEIARAVVALAEAIDAGFIDIAHIEADPELDVLRGLAEFRLVVRRLELRLIAAGFTASKPFPFAFSLNDLDGKPVSLADFKGKVLVVNFWGTAYPPCRKQVPHLVELFKRYHDQGLEVVGLTAEPATGAEARKAVRAFAEQAGIPYSCLIGNEATENLVPNFSGYPTTLFIDRAGKVRLGLTGYQPLSSLEAAAAALLGENRGAEENGREKEGKGKEKQEDGKGKGTATEKITL